MTTDKVSITDLDNDLGLLHLGCVINADADVDYDNEN